MDAYPVCPEGLHAHAGIYSMDMGKALGLSLRPP